MTPREFAAIAHGWVAAQPGAGKAGPAVTMDEIKELERIAAAADAKRSNENGRH